MKAALVTLGVLAALVASGSATVEQATNAGMKGVVPFALVVLLEVVNVAGTWTWMSDDRAHVQWEAAAGVGAASIVTGVCGILSYGPVGVVPAIGVLFTVHLVGRLRHRPATAAVSEQSHAVTEPEPQVTTIAEPIAPATPDAIPEPIANPSLNPPETHSVSESVSDSVPEGIRTERDPAPVGDSDDARIADLRAFVAEFGKMPGRDVVKARYGVGSSTANRLREQAARPQLTIARGGA